MRSATAIATMLLVSSNPAHAVCVEGYASDFARAVNGSLEYLVCLHNEQNERLNEQAVRIKKQSGYIAELMEKVAQVETENARLRVGYELIQKELLELRDK